MPTKEELRSELAPLPDRLKDLPVFRGYPVPWFVAWQAGEPEFRAADGRKWGLAVRQQLCWVCGRRMGAYQVYLLGPMCILNMTTVEPPCHRECAIWSVTNCPFLTRPQMVRRENDLPPEMEQPGGLGLSRNPGVTALWLTRGRAHVFYDAQHKPLLRVPDEHEDVQWWSQGRAATRAEVIESVAGGLPLLEPLAIADGPEAVAELRERQRFLESIYPEA